MERGTATCNVVATRPVSVIPLPMARQPLLVLRVPHDLDEEIDRVAETRGRSKSAVVRAAIRVGLRQAVESAPKDSLPTDTDSEPRDSKRSRTQ